MEEIFLKGLAQNGPIALCLAAVIIFIGRRLLRLEEAFDRLTKMELLRLVASPHVSPDLKEAAAGQLEEVKQSEMRRRKP